MGTGFHPYKGGINILELKFIDYVKDDSYIYIADLTMDNSGKTIIHKHDFYEFFVVMEGEFYEYCNGQIKPLSYGHFHFIQPEDQHYFKSKGNAGRNILRNIAINKSYLDKLMAVYNYDVEILMKNNLPLKKLCIDNFIMKSDMLIGHSPTALPPRFIFESLFSDLIIEVSSNQYEFMPPWLRRAYDLTKKHQYYIEGLDKFIELCDKSQEHVTREMKKYFGTTPSEFIQDLRLIHAAKQLTTTQDKIIDIIYSCGFSNPSYFNRSFKNKYGMTPRDYRKMNNTYFSISI